MNIALIVGCARSGTSILGEAIASHPHVAYVFEPHHVWELGGLGVDGCHRLTAQHATPAITARIRQWFEEQRGAARVVVDKTPRNVLRVPFVREIFPEAKLIHIVRDGRDVACSMVPGCGGRRWAHLKPPSWKELLSRYEGAVRCALAWKEVMEIGLQDLRKVPHLQIRYEDLALDPVGVARTVLRYIDLDEHLAVRQFCSRIRDSTKGSYQARSQVKWYRDNHDSRIGRWRENLNEEEQRTINEKLSDLLRHFGYE